MLKIAIVGSRDYANLPQIRHYVQSLPRGTIIVSGGARGVDSVAEAAAVECGLQTLIFYPDWDKHGRSAGFIRNNDIIKSSDIVVAFWDGVSRGTLSSINLAKKYGKPLVIYLCVIS